MPTTQQLRSRLVKKLEELFQLNHPDLDFGFYRIMHAKAGQVTRFLEDDLLAFIADSFGQIDDSRKARLEAEYEKELETAREYGAADPESVRKVKEARARYETAQDTASAEGEIYDHLYRFFERYYDNGDFISRRYYTRETPGKAAPFAVPYNGEEVKLHWANADQYYIKTAEHFRNFTVDLRQAKEIQEHSKADKLGLEIGDTPPRLIHFRIVDATEGEHGNIRASEATKRYFVIHKDEPVALTGEGELVIQFEYRPDPDKSGQEKTWRAKRNAEAVEVVLAALDDLAAEDEYKFFLTVPAPTEKDKDRPLLAKYINQYTARNTMDYFIHKNLGAFLRRELDFYIKNEVMRLDDISTAEAPAVETYLSKLKVLRTIAHKLIDFLAQIEDFQKRLWLKKKFVVETNYCITLDRIPEEFYPEITANDAQREEWVRLFAIDEIEASTVSVGYSEPLTADFLRANQNLVVDTAFFGDAFRHAVLASLDDVQESTDGLLVHSENFQGLSLLAASKQQQVQSLYIDPPYNAAATEIIYKNEYKHSSWCSFIFDRLATCRHLLTNPGIICVTIDDYEVCNLKPLMDLAFGPDAYLATVPIRNNPSGRSTVSGFSVNHEYALFYALDPNRCTVGRLPHSAEQRQRYDLTDEDGRQFEWENFRKNSAGSFRRDRPRQYFPIYYRADSNAIRIPKMIWNQDAKEWSESESPTDGEQVIWPTDAQGRPRVWRFGKERTERELFEIKAEVRGKTVEIYKRKYIHHEGSLPRTWWDKPDYSARDHGTRVLNNLFGIAKDFDFPKAVGAVADCLKAASLCEDSEALDFFAGSGTTGHAVIAMNRKDHGERKYTLVEMGNYFDTILRPRIEKVVYAEDWANGKPLDRSKGVSHFFKYIRLESYEDCLNNLVFCDDEGRNRALARNTSLRQDYTLHYMLDVETRGSQSLLNIDAFADPTAYTLRIKKSDSDQYVTRNVDLIETFNYLIGLRVTHIAAPQTFNATFKRETDPELPEDTQTRLVVDGRLTQDEDGPWWFRKVEGWMPADPNNPNNGERRNVLIVWRKLTGKIEEDNLMLDEWFQQNRNSAGCFEFDVIYVNGSNNLPILKQKGDDWKVRLIEEDFMRLMWDVEEV